MSAASTHILLVRYGRTELKAEGRFRVAACFVTDLGTVLALGGFFANFGVVLLVFVAVSGASLALLPLATRFVIRTVGHRVSEPEIKFLLVVLLGLGALATRAGSEAVLPAYLVGLVVAGICLHRILIDRLRSMRANAAPAPALVPAGSWRPTAYSTPTSAPSPAAPAASTTPGLSEPSITSAYARLGWHGVRPLGSEQDGRR